MIQSKVFLPKYLIKYLVVLILPAVNLGWIIVALLNQPIAKKLVREDDIIQWVQFYLLLFTSLYCIKIVYKYKNLYENKLIMYFFLTCFFLVLILAFEEISWGQRIFNIKTPEIIKTINAQNQITLHNLICFQRYRHWLLLSFGLVGLSLIYIKTNTSKIDIQLIFFIPPSFFKLAYSLVLISAIVLEISFLLKTLFPGPLTKEFRFWAGRYSEVGELGVAVTAFSYAAYKFNELTNSRENRCCPMKLQIKPDK